MIRFLITAFRRGGRKKKGSINQGFTGLSSQAQKGMSLGNLTSQFFANVYLNELDQYVKHTLKVKYYIRYVDDFVILDSTKEKLSEYKKQIDRFLNQKLSIELHPDKSSIIQLERGIVFLGFRIFPNHQLLKKTNMRRFRNKFKELKDDYNKNKIDYDIIYDFLEGWLAHIKHANTYNMRKKIIEDIEKKFPNEISTKEFNKIRKIFQMNKNYSL